MDLEPKMQDLYSHLKRLREDRHKSFTDHHIQGALEIVYELLGILVAGKGDNNSDGHEG